MKGGLVKRAIISDIHSNLEALEAVLADSRRQGVTEIFCLGDLVGYGPNPLECIDIMMNLKMDKVVCLLGNHDQAAGFDPEGFNSVAEQAIFWTREQLERAHGPRKSERWDFIWGLPRIYKSEDGFLFVHGSPRSPLNEYVFADDIIEEQKMMKLFSIIPQYCFQGHTHVPGIFTESGKYIRMSDVQGAVYKLSSEKLMVNVGSVGQPRDRDPRACYVLYDSEQMTIEYRRVEYDCEKTCKKICNIPELDNFLGERIKQGK